MQDALKHLVAIEEVLLKNNPLTEWKGTKMACDKGTETGVVGAPHGCS